MQEFRQGIVFETIEALRDSDWGSVAPNRLARRGKQKELERWVLRRFLLARLHVRDLRAPISVFESEAPDFFLCSQGQDIGVEIVEAVESSEQIQWTREANGQIEFNQHIDLMNPERPAAFFRIVSAAVRNKSASISTKTDELLIYANTHSNAFEDAQWELDALENLRIESDVLKRVWLLSGSALLDLTNRTYIER